MCELAECRAGGCESRSRSWTLGGRPVRAAIGEKLVSDAMPSIPSMPIALWNASDAKRDRDACFTVFPGAGAKAAARPILLKTLAAILGRSGRMIDRSRVSARSGEIYALAERDRRVADSSRWYDEFALARAARGARQ